MPCYDPDLDRTETVENLQRATRAACDLLHAIRGGLSLDDVSAETKAWIKEHDRQDQRRNQQAEEAKLTASLRHQALKKLSQDERRALGL